MPHFVRVGHSRPATVTAPRVTNIDHDQAATKHPFKKRHHSLTAALHLSKGKADAVFQEVIVRVLQRWREVRDLAQAHDDPRQGLNEPTDRPSQQVSTVDTRIQKQSSLGGGRLRIVRSRYRPPARRCPSAAHTQDTRHNEHMQLSFVQPHDFRSCVRTCVRACIRACVHVCVRVSVRVCISRSR